MERYLTRHVGHRDKFSNDPSFNKILMCNRGNEKITLYAWVRSDGELLSTPTKSLESALALKKEIQEKCNKEIDTAFLNLFCYEGTDQILKRPVIEKQISGGCAIGGPPNLNTADELLEELKKTVQEQYAKFKECEFYVKNNSAYLERDNVRVWITRSDELGMEKPLNLPFKWSVHVSMIKNWNEDYHDVHIFNFRDGYDAIEEAVTAFVRYQIIEKFVDYF